MCAEFSSSSLESTLSHKQYFTATSLHVQVPSTENNQKSKEAQDNVQHVPKTSTVGGIPLQDLTHTALIVIITHQAALPC